MAMNESIMFRPGDDRVIKMGHKLVTLRLPDDKYLFQRGQQASALCGNIPVSTTVFDTGTGPLNKLHPALRAFDGFFDIKTAVNQMKEIGGRYQDVKENTPFVWIGHVSNSIFETLSPEAQKSLINDPMEQYLRDKQLIVELFGPAIIYWAQQRGLSKAFTNRFIEKTSKSSFKGGPPSNS